MEAEEGVALRSSNKGEGRWAREVRRRLPIVTWAREYDRLTALADLVAGVTLGLTLVPQSIAYAALADLPVQYGLYTSFMGTILYMFLGTVKEVSIGPTSLMALLVLQACRGLPVEYVVLLTFLSGCVVLAMGLLRLGFMVELISSSVTSGFTSATALIIVVAQLKGVLGLSFTAESVHENLQQIAMRWRDIRLNDCALAAVCCTVLLLLRKVKDVKVRGERARRALWLLSIGRNALVVLAGAIFACCTYDPDHVVVKLSGRVEPGLPPLALPPFSVTEGNHTTSFPDMVRRIGPSVLMLPVVMVIANIAIAKAFTTGGRVDATQEMTTLGLCNMAGALVSAMPACGAFTRSAVAHSSGVRSPAAGLYSGIITLLALIFLTEYFYFIPKACLSSVLICAVIFMIDIRTVRELWGRSRSELTVLCVTMGVSLAGTVELGVLAGVLASLALLLRSLRRAPVHYHALKTEYGEVVRVRPSLAMVYVNAELVAARARAACELRPRAPVLLDCGRLGLLDLGGEQVLERLAEKFEKSGRALIPYNASAVVLRQLEALDKLERRALRAPAPAAALALVGPPPSAPLATDRPDLAAHDPLLSAKDEFAIELQPAGDP